MTVNELLADAHERNLQMLKSTLADFSDADMLVRPAPSANHAAWMLGHLILSEMRLVAMINPSAPAPLPPDFAAKFSKDTAKLNDASSFPRKDELFRQYDVTLAATVKWIRSLSESDLDKPGPEPIRARFPTVGSLTTMLLMHRTMHLGQFQVIRRVLGKPVLM